MNAIEIISVFQSRGIALSMNDTGGIRVTAPRALTDEERSALKRYKVDMLRALALSTAANQQPPVAAPMAITVPAASYPYRLNIDGRVQLVWLASGLKPAEVLRQSRVLHPGVVVIDEPPAHGWPRLADIPQVPKAGTPRPVECWTPSGKRRVVTASSPERAEAIRRLNPPPAADRLEAYEERAAILEFDGNRPRQEAEQKAARCYYCSKHRYNTKLGRGWWVVQRLPVQRRAGDSCEQFTVESRS